jgi:class 3 adenylate cyclase
VAAPARILIVDDEPFNRDVLAQELELLDHEPLAAVHGRDALERLESEPVDLILLDIMMPGLDGFEVLRRLKDDPRLRHIPVIMVSALDDLESVVRCVELGAEDYLPKPFDPVLLKARIGACLEKKRWRDQEQAYLERIERQIGEIERERARADRLLHAILPPSAVAELKAQDRVSPKRYERVAVLFGDLVSFTPYCERHPAEEVVANLDQLTRACEELVRAHGLEKIKTIGDAYMVAAGVPIARADHARAIAQLALDMVEATSVDGICADLGVQLRVGINSGPVVAGVIGRRKFLYDLWGDSVNTASRMESGGTPGRIQVTHATYELLRDDFELEPRGTIDVKGKGPMQTWYLVARRGASVAASA